MQILLPDQAAIDTAARALEQGNLIAFPTETVYGLGADAENPAAVAKIYAAKGRPANHPVIVHLAPDADVAHWTTSIPAEARKLIDAFWPGPLTLILKRAAMIPDAVSGGQDSIGLRCPSHPVAQALLRAFRGGRGGIAAPSANRFGHVSPTTAQHVRDEFIAESGNNPLIAAILDGGQSQVGIESTILDLSRLHENGAPTLLRPGHISAAQIAGIIGRFPVAPTQAAPRASGTLDAHYAPQTPTVLLAASAFLPTATRLAQHGKRLALLPRSDFDLSQLPGAPIAGQRNMPAEVEAYAHQLYSALREADRMGADLLLVESPPADVAWSGVNDRLQRAAFSTTGTVEKILNGN